MTQLTVNILQLCSKSPCSLQRHLGQGRADILGALGFPICPLVPGDDNLCCTPSTDKEGHLLPDIHVSTRYLGPAGIKLPPLFRGVKTFGTSFGKVQSLSSDTVQVLCRQC